MLTATLALCALVVAVAVLVTVPWRPSFALEARGAPDGSWAVAGGIGLAGCSLSFARARSTPTLVALAIFGRTVVRRKLVAAPASTTAGPGALDRATGAYQRLERWVDPLELAIFLVDETGRVGVRDVEGHVEVGLADVALAGRIAGVLIAAAALLSPFGRLRHAIDWSGREHLDASVSLRLRFSPALLVFDGARFVLKNVRRRRVLATPAPAPGA